MCLGKRFGEYELRALAAVLLTRVRFELCSAEPPRIVTTPTLGRGADALHDSRPVRRAAAANDPPLVAPIPLLVAVIVLTIGSRVVT